jgi:protein involved in polysaccharide export with SLBB domain
MDDAFLAHAVLHRERPDLTLEIIQVDLGNILNGSKPDIELQKNDVLYVPSIHDLKDLGTVDVLGEVARPGQFEVTRDQITILEALAMAGDMTIYGNRENVTVVRKEDGQTKTYRMNLLDAQCFASPAYYLQQGDVVYVQPKKQRAATGEINQNRSFWISIASTLLSAASLVMTIINFAQK